MAPMNGGGVGDIKAVKKRYDEGSMTNEKGMRSPTVTESTRSS